MKASKMTNEQLARNLKATILHLSEETLACTDTDDILREAAARLRRPTPVDDDLLKMARDIDVKNAEIAGLREFSNDIRTWFRLYYSCGSHPESKWWRSCASCRRKRCPIHKWRKALEGAKNG